jgi:hypothetical protein
LKIRHLKLCRHFYKFLPRNECEYVWKIEILKKKKKSRFQNFIVLSMRLFDKLQYSKKWYQEQLYSLYLVKKNAIYVFFQEFLTIFIQEISKNTNSEYEIIFRTPKRTKWYRLHLCYLYLVKVMAIPDFSKEFLSFFYSRNFKNSKFLLEDHMKNSKTHKMIPVAAL